MKNKPLSLLRIPYPTDESILSIFVRSLVASLIVVYVMLVFKPFGANAIPGSYRNIILISYSIPTFLSVLITGLVINRVKRGANHSQWVLYKELLAQLLTVFTVAIGNYLHAMLIFNADFSVSNLSRMMWNTLSIAYIPWSGIIILDWIIKFRKDQHFAVALNQKVICSHEANKVTCKPIHLVGKNQNEEIVIPEESILFFKSEANYVSVNYLSESGKITEYLLRSTLKQVEQALANQSNAIVRIHRCFLVNLAQIDETLGNTQGLKLRLKHGDQSIPVSRKFAKSVLL